MSAKILKIHKNFDAKSSHGLPLLHVEKIHSGDDADETKLRLAHENMILRQKVVELTQAVIILQQRTKDAQNFKEIIRNDHVVKTEDCGMNRIKNETQVENKAIKNATNLSESVTLWTNALKSLSDKERNRVLRSKRREHLTWRNKAQSWLSKMVKAGDKLLEAKECFTQQEYLEQLLLFHKKLSQQGDIIETAREAGLIYLIICDTSSKEKEIAQFNIQSLKSDYESILVKIVERIDTLRMMHMSIAIPPQELAMSLQNECRDYLKYDDDSYDSFNRMALLMTKYNDSHAVATSTKSCIKDSYAMLSLADENDSSRTPIFV